MYLDCGQSITAGWVMQLCPTNRLKCYHILFFSVDCKAKEKWLVLLMYFNVKDIAILVVCNFNKTNVVRQAMTMF